MLQKYFKKTFQKITIETKGSRIITALSSQGMDSFLCYFFFQPSLAFYSVKKTKAFFSF